MIKALLIIWQLPQNLLGFAVLKILKAKKYLCLHAENKGIKYISVKKWFNGVSLGEYVLIDDEAYEYEGFTNGVHNVVLHEHGHRLQSRRLGPLYLLLVGLPSISRNIYDRVFHKGSKWYYGHYPENWADRLGGVKR